jgi:hypothetical protein
MDKEKEEKKVTDSATAKILLDLPSLTGYPTWGQQKVNKGWLVWATHNSVITALTFLPD